MIKPEPFLGLLRRSGRYWLLVLRGRHKDRDLHPFTFYSGVFRSSGVLGCVGVQLKIIPLYQDKCYLYLKSVPKPCTSPQNLGTPFSFSVSSSRN